MSKHQSVHPLILRGVSLDSNTFKSGDATDLGGKVEETCYHRWRRLRYCNDHWTSTPPWDKIDNEKMKSWYELSSPYQYSFDTIDLAESVNWVGCYPPPGFITQGWP